jgi:hypothetical protein
MAEMEAWVQAQLMWNPKQDQRALIREFLQGYYGAAWKPISDYMDLLSAAAQNTNGVIWMGPDSPCYSLATMLNADMLWNKAEAAVALQPELLQRVRVGHLPVRYVMLSRWEPFRAEAAQEGLPWPASRRAMADKWMAVATTPIAPGVTPITTMNEGGLSPQSWAAQFAQDVSK